MAVIVVDLLEPNGPLDPAFFPDTEEQLTVRLQAYIDRAVTKVAAYEGVISEEDSAARSWALHLAFSALYLLKANSPGSASMEDLGSVSTAKDQRDAFKEQADFYASEYLLLAPEVTINSSVSPTVSRAVPNTFRW